MSDEQAAEQQTAEAAPADDGGDDEQVVLTRSQLAKWQESTRNSAFAEARKHFSSRESSSVDDVVAKVTADPRIQRGLKMLEDSERTDAFQAKVLDSLRADPRRRGQDKPATAQTAAPASAADRYFELLMAREVRAGNEAEAARVAAAQKPTTPHDRINAEIAALDPEMDSSKRNLKVQNIVATHLRGVKIKTTK